MSTRLRIGPALLVSIVIGGTAIGPVTAVQRSAPRRTKPPGDSEIEYASPEVARLEMFVGVWSITENHFNAHGDVVATVKGREDIRWILDHRAIRRNYTSGIKPAIFRAVGTLTWNDVEKRYHGVWFDNVSTAGPTEVKGEWSDETLTMVFTLKSLDKSGSPVRHKVVERFIDKERRIATTYLIRGAESVKRMEVQYRRAAPCPGRIRPIFDELLGRPQG